MNRPAQEAAGLRVGLVVSRFPKFTETFVVNEILGLERLGLNVEIHPLLPMEPEPHQPAAAPLVARAHFGSLAGRDSLAAAGAWLRRRPVALVGVLLRLVADTWRRPRVLVKDLVLVPRVCRMASDLCDQGVHHVHAHFATHAGFAAWAVHRLTGLPYSIVGHGSDIHKHQAMLATKVREAAFVATVSEFNRQVILSASRPEDAHKVVLARAGIDLPDTPPRAGPAPGPPTVLCVGTLHEVKGQAHLIRAVGRLVAEGRDVRLDLVGDGPDRPALEALVGEAGLGAHVRLLGAMAHDEVIASYRDAAVVVAPSVASRDGRKEGIPTVLVEAMAAGVPVVASDLAGIPELVRPDDTGILVPPGDPSAIAAAVGRLLDDHALGRRLADRARTLVRDEFDLDRTTAAMAHRIAAASVPGARA